VKVEFLASKWTVGVLPIQDVQRTIGRSSLRISTVEQAPNFKPRRARTKPVLAPGSGVVSDEAVSPCMVAVPLGPTHGLASGRGSNCASAAYEYSINKDITAISAALMTNSYA
jgi:hypothetical protein